MEIKRGEVWGTVQDADWTNDDGLVVCRMLNVPSGAPDVGNVYTGGQSTGVANTVPVYISNIVCQGSETTLLDCVYTLKETSTTYDHTNDVGVLCGKFYVAYTL